MDPHTATKDQAEPDGDLQSLYGKIDTETGRLFALHGSRMKCGRGCSRCCVDDVTVAEVEADNIRRHHQDLLTRGIPQAPGMCAFLDDQGACRIYEHRPYVCRSQGLPLRWIDQDEEGRFVELRDICPLNEEGEPVEALPGESCWSIGWAEQALAELQGVDEDGDLRRVALRGLFTEAPRED
jgi:hypothetical protein